MTGSVTAFAAAAVAGGPEVAAMTIDSGAESSRRVRPGTLLALCCGMLIASSMFAAHAFDLQGHRGARGLLPENTLAGFEHTLDIGVTTLELDIAITARFAAPA